MDSRTLEQIIAQTLEDDGHEFTVVDIPTLTQRVLARIDSDGDRPEPQEIHDRLLRRVAASHGAARW